MFDTKGKPLGQLAQDAVNAFKNNGQFLKQQPRDKLMVIIQALQGQSIFQHDEIKRNEFLGVAKLAREQIKYSQDKEKLKRDTFTFHLNSRAGVKDINYTQAILILITTLIAGLIGYYEYNQKPNYLTYIIGASIIALLLSFFVIVIYNSCCQKRIVKAVKVDIQEQAQIFMSSPERKK